MSAIHKTFKVYEAYLAVYCPYHSKTDKTDQVFLRTIVEMEKDIMAELVKRDCDVNTVRRYLSGCFQQLICGTFD
jgi:hypothetical protein